MNKKEYEAILEAIMVLATTIEYIDNGREHERYGDGEYAKKIKEILERIEINDE